MTNYECIREIARIIDEYHLGKHYAQDAIAAIKKYLNQIDHKRKDENATN